VQEICSHEIADFLGSAIIDKEEAMEILAHGISQKIAHELTRIMEQRAQDSDAAVPLIIVPQK
jgi:hypothetical protein